MKFTILKENLSKSLQAVEKITGKNLVLPILNNALLSAEKNSLKLTTTDLEIAISFWSLAKIEQEGEITVPVKVLSGFVSFIGDSRVEISAKGKIFHISGKGYKTQIKGLDPKDFPIIPKIERNDWIEINPIALCEGISQVIDFCSITQARPELSGIYFEFSKEQLKIVATDSFRLAEKTLFFEKPQAMSSGKSFILPKNAAREIVNLFSNVQEKIKIYFSPNQIMLESCFNGTQNPRIQLISRLIEGEFPNYKEIIPKDHKTRIVVSREQFLAGIKSASVFSGRGNELKVEVDSQKDFFGVFAQDTEIGETNISIPAKVEGERVSTCFNYRFLMEGAAKLKSKEIFFDLNGEGGAGLIKDAGAEKNFVYILMPIKQG